jgi:hypothetical protein
LYGHFLKDCSKPYTKRVWRKKGFSLRDEDDEGLVKEFGIEGVQGMGQGELQGSTNLEENCRTKCDSNILIGYVSISLIVGLMPPLGNDKYPEDIRGAGHAQCVPSYSKKDDRIHAINSSSLLGKVVNSLSIFVSSDNVLGSLISGGSGSLTLPKKPGVDLQILFKNLNLTHW